MTYNEEKTIGKLKQAVDQLDLPDGVRVETILVDGGSSDRTVDVAREAGFDEIIELPGANIPICRNRGWRAAHGEWIAFLDGDCIPEHDWVQHAAEYLCSDEPTVIGWPVVPPSDGSWVQRAWHVHWSCKNKGVDQKESVVKQDAFRLITTRNMLLHRLVLDSIDGFDEVLSTGEDTDLVFRAYLKGFRVLGVPSLKVEHLGEPQTAREFFKQQLWHANRASYKKIVALGRGKTGGNAPMFTMAFLISVILGGAGIVLAALSGACLSLLLLLPLVGVVALPVGLISVRAGTARYVPALMALYILYGVARSIDLLGLHRTKKSWKVK